jgi:hypothetical protein
VGEPRLPGERLDGQALVDLAGSLFEAAPSGPIFIGLDGRDHDPSRVRQVVRALVLERLARAEPGTAVELPFDRVSDRLLEWGALPIDPAQARALLEELDLFTVVRRERDRLVVRPA